MLSVAKGGSSMYCVYDRLGRVLKRTVDGVKITVYAYDGWKPIMEWSELGSRDIDGKAERPSRAGASESMGRGGQLPGLERLWAGSGRMERFGKARHGRVCRYG